MKSKQVTPIIVDQDLEKIAQLYAAIGEAVPLLQSAWDSFKESKFFDARVTLSFLAGNHEHLKFKYKLKVAPKLAPIPEGLGIEVDEADAVKRYKVPTPELDQDINQVKEVFARTGVNFSYFFVKDDQVKVNEQTVAKVTDRYTIAATTEKEIEFVKLVNSFINSATKLNKFLKGNRMEYIFLHKLHPIQINRLMVMHEEEKYKLNPHAFARISKQLSRLKPVKD